MKTRKVVVIDGQGGSIGKSIIEQLKRELPEQKIIAIGTNSNAAAVMKKSGADQCATGENPILVACEDAEIIAGPIGILIPNSLLGEITPAMATAVGKSHAEKVVVPVNKCKIWVAGNQELPLGESIVEAVSIIRSLLTEAEI